MRHKPIVVSQRTLARTRHFEVEERVLRFRNGGELRAERLRDGGHQAVAVVAMLDENRVILIEEYAAGVHAFSLGLPMGGVAAEESIEDAARRELAEETGYTATHITRLQTLRVVPSHLEHSVCVCVATGLHAAEATGDELETPTVHSYPLSRLFELVASGELVEARSIAALAMARDWLQERGSA